MRHLTTAEALATYYRARGGRHGVRVRSTPDGGTIMQVLHTAVRTGYHDVGAVDHATATALCDAGAWDWRDTPAR